MRSAILVLSLFLCVGVMAQDVPSGNNIVLGGFKYDAGPYFITGAGQNIDGGLWSFEYVTSGVDQSASVEVAYLIPVNEIYNLGTWSSKVFFGPIAGPTADWINTENDDLPTMSYLNGSAGGIVSANPISDLYVWGAYKNKFTFVDNAFHKTGWLAGVGLGWRF